MFKRVLGLLLVFALVITAVPAMPLSVSAKTTGVTKGGCEWELDNGKLEIYGNGEMGSPETPWGSEVKEVYIHQGVTSIGSYAFQNCTSLTKVTLPNSLLRIYWNAFENCTSLTTLTLPGYLKEIGAYAFRGCTSLTTLTVPSSVTSIGMYVFYNCTALTSFTFPNGVTAVPESAFRGCTALTTVNVSPNTTYVGPYAFYGCRSLKNVTLPDTVTAVRKGAFEGCWQLSAMPNIKNVKSISEFLFRDCTSLKKIVVPDGVTTIERSAFSGCTALTEVVIPSTVTSIGSAAFYHCTALPQVTIPSTVTVIEDSLFSGCSSLREFTIPSGVTRIGAGAFSGCTLLETLTLPNSLTAIENNTFSDCSSLRTLALPDGVTSIGDFAFHNCALLEELELPDGVTSIGQQAFSGCRALREMDIPDGVTSIGRYTFYECASLKRIHIPDGVTSIGDYAFSGCMELESVTIPRGVTVISTSLFSLCYCLKEIVLPEGVTSIGDSAFFGCISLVDVNIPEHVQSIGAGAFRGTRIVNVTVPAATTYLGKQAFDGCSALTDVVILGEISEIGNATFSGCTSLQKVVLPNSVTRIGSEAFRYCSSLERITLPQELTQLSTYVFDQCIRLKDVTVPSSLTYVADRAFQNCSSLADVWYTGTETQKKAITLVGAYNNYFKSATWHYEICRNQVHAYEGACDDSCAYCETTRITTAQHTYTNGFDTVCNVCDGGRATTDTVEGQFTYRVEDGYAVITGCHPDASGDVTVPSRIGGYTVTAIASGTFYKCSKIVTLTIPSSVTTIDDGALGVWCAALKRVEVASDNQYYSSIGGVLYTKNTSKLIYMPPAHVLYLQVTFTYFNGEQVKAPIREEQKIGTNYHFEVPDVPGYSANYESISGTVGIRDIFIDVVYYEQEKISSGACGDAITWTLYDNGLLIFRGTGAMPQYTSGTAPWHSNAANVKTVVIDPRITSIGNYAFQNCRNLTYVDYGYRVSSIGEYAFSGCTSLTSFVLPETVTVIARGAFQQCSGLKTVIVPDRIRTIEPYAFYGCDALTQVTVGAAVTGIGENAFAACPKLQQVYFRGRPATLGGNALGTATGKYVYYYSTVDGWDDGITNGLWNGYTAIPYDIISKAEFDGSNPYIIKIVDKNNQPLAGAKVTFGDNAEQTVGADGMAYFVKPTEAQSLTVTCDDHRDFTDTAFQASALQLMDIVVLSDKPSTVQGVRVNNDSIATSVRVVNAASDEVLNITVSGYSKYTIVRYELYQGNRLIATTKTDGTTATLVAKASAFEEGETVFVKMHTSDGQAVSETLNLDVVKMASVSATQILDELSGLDLSFGVGGLGSYKIPMTFQASGGEKVYTVIKGRTIRVGINLDIADFFKKKGDDAPKGPLHKMVDDAMKTGIKNKGDYAGFEYNVCGYVEIEYLGNNQYYVKTCYVKIGVTAKLSFNVQASYLGIVGVYFKASWTGETTVDLKITRYGPEEGFGLDDLNFNLEHNFHLEGGAYVLWGIGSAGVYGKLQLGFVLGIKPELGFESVYVKGEVGVKWSLLWGLRTGKHVIAAGNIYRWPEARNVMMRLLASGAPDAYEFNDRAYLDARSEWLSGAYLQRNVYDNVAPQIVVCDDVTMMVWLDDNRDRDDANFQMLYYSLYQNGTWTEPAAVADNGTFDCEFDVYADGETVYVVYSEMTEENRVQTLDADANDDVVDAIGDVEVSVVTYRNGAFGTPVQLTENDACELLPRIEAVNGTVTAAWVQSEGITLNGGTSGNAVCTATLGNGGWSVPTVCKDAQPSVSDVVSVVLGGETYTAYVMDTDQNSATRDDQVLVAVDGSGHAFSVDSGMIAGVERATVGGTEMVTWYKDGRIYALSAPDATPVCLTPENAVVGATYKVVPLDGGETLLTFVMDDVENDGCDVYGVFADQNGALTAPVPIAQTDGYVANYDVVYQNGALNVVFTETFATVEGDDVHTTSNLRCETVAFVTDVALKAVAFDRTFARAGATVAVTLTVENRGTETVDGLTVNLYGADGTLLYTTVCDGVWESGETKACDVNVTVPTTVADAAYTIEVLPRGKADADTDDNRAALPLAFADLAVAAEQRIIGGKNYLVITLKNRGNVPSGATLELFAPHVGGRKIGDITVDAVNPDASEQYMVELNLLTTRDDKSVTCVVTSTVEDPFTIDNTETVSLLHLDDEVFTADPDVVIRNPEISASAVSFDKYVPQDITINLTAEADGFSGIEGLKSGVDYVRVGDTLTVRGAYFLTLDKGEHLLRLLFDFGQATPTVRTLTVTVADSTPVPLDGRVNIAGEALVEETVSADLTDLVPSNADVTFEWSVGGNAVGTARTYTVRPEDNGKTLTLTVRGVNGFSGTLTATRTVTLRTPSAPLTPVVSFVDSRSLSVVKVGNVEYSIDGIHWQDAATFNGLQPNVCYTVYARVKATATHFASAYSTVIVRTHKLTVGAPTAPLAENVTHDTVTLVHDPALEYKIEGGEWTDVPTFTNLTPDTVYRFYQRYRETETAYAGPASAAAFRTAGRASLEGAVAVTGEPQYGEVLTVDLSGINADPEFLAIRWYCAGMLVGSGASYTVSADAMGKTVEVRVSGIGAYQGDVCASLNVRDYVIGDVNGDLAVDEDDATVLRSYVALWVGVDVNLTAADVNHDGVVNVVDVTVLRRYVAGWVGYENLFIKR